MAQEYIYFGKRKQVRYNPESKRVCPSDCWFIFMTCFIIVVPTGATYYLIVANEEIDEWLICLLILVESGTLFLCLWALFSAAFTEPGIIPRMKSMPGDYVVSNPKQAQYVEYMNTSELEQ